MLKLEELINLMSYHQFQTQLLDYNHLLLDGHLKDITKDALQTLVGENKEAGLLYVSIYKKALEYIKLAQSVTIVGFEYAGEKMGFGNGGGGFFNILDDDNLLNDLVHYLMYRRVQEKKMIFEQESKKINQYPNFKEEIFLEANMNPKKDLITRLWLLFAQKLIGIYDLSPQLTPSIENRQIDRKTLLNNWFHDHVSETDFQEKIPRTPKRVRKDSIDNFQSVILLPANESNNVVENFSMPLLEEKTTTSPRSISEKNYSFERESNIDTFTLSLPVSSLDISTFNDENITKHIETKEDKVEENIKLNSDQLVTQAKEDDQILEEKNVEDEIKSISDDEEEEAYDNTDEEDSNSDSEEYEDEN